VRPDRDSDRDSGSPRDDDALPPEVETRRALWRMRAREKNEAGLKRIGRPLKNYDPWQRGLLQLACRWRDRVALHDEIDKERRGALYRARRAAAAQKRRAPGSAAPIKGTPGRPRTGLDGILYAGARAQREHGTTFAEIASFLVDTIGRYYLPPELRGHLAIGRTRTEQKHRLAQRLRRLASRQLA
jgi:hypothetical protein